LHGKLVVAKGDPLTTNHDSGPNQSTIICQTQTRLITRIW
jgi:hypothetical protein